MTKQLVNLVGALVSIAVLAAGVFLLALPQFTSAQQLNASAASVEQSNGTQQAVLDALNTQAADMTTLDAEVAELREVIPTSVRADDIVLIAAEAAAAYGGALTTVTVGETTPFAPRAMEAAVDDASAEAAVEGESTGDAAPADAAPADAAPATTPTDGAPADGPQQVTLELTMTTPGVASATAAIDALRNGPRAVAITQAGISTADDGVVTATVSVLTFYDAD